MLDHVTRRECCQQGTRCHPGLYLILTGLQTVGNIQLTPQQNQEAGMLNYPQPLHVPGQAA